MNLAQRTMRAGAWQFVSLATKAVLQVVVLGVLARYVSPTDFGYVAVANMVVVFAEILAEAGIGPALVQKHDLEEEHLRAGFVLSVGLGVGIVALLWLSAPAIAALFDAAAVAGVVKYVGLSVLITKLGAVSRARIEREMRVDILMWVDVLSYVAGYAAVGTIMAVLGFGVWAIVAGKLTQSCLQTVGVLATRPSSPRPASSLKAYRELISFGGGLTLARLFDNIASQGDYFIVGRFLGSAPLGLYERASAIAAMPGQYLSATLDKSLFPAMSQVQDQSSRLETAYFRAASFVSVVIIPASVLMIVVAPELVAVLLGPNWRGSILPFRILAMGALFRALVGVSDTLVRAKGAVYASALRKALVGVAVIGGSAIGQQFGLVGVAVAADVAVLIGYLLMTQLSFRIVESSVRDYVGLHKHGVAVGGVLLLCVLPIVMIMRVYTESNVLILGAALSCTGALMLLLVVRFPRLLGAACNEVVDHLLSVVGVKRPRAPAAAC